MPIANIINNVNAKARGWSRPLCEDSAVRLVTAEDERESLRFLSSRPVHTINLRAFIRENGMTSALNRGEFYGYRNPKGELEGVALIGHATLVEASTDRALEALARKAQGYGRTHMIMGEQERIEEFWSYYAEDGQRKRLVCRELLFELRWPVEALEKVSGLRPATLNDLELILPVQSAMAEAESSVNPMTKEAEGFRKRCARRIEQGKTWVLIEDGKLVFKTEVFAATPEATYLEGIYVNEEERGKGYGLRCLSQLTRELLQRTERLCILVNERNTAAHAFYRKLGFKFTSIYDTIFLKQN